MDKFTMPPNDVVSFNYANGHGGSGLIHEANPGGASAGAASALPAAVVQNMTALAAFLQTDIGAAWALAGELSGGVPAMQMIIFGSSAPALAALTVGAVAYGGTRALDDYFDGAIHTSFLNAVEQVARMDVGVADKYFGGDSFTVNNEKMMSDICSNWEDFWEDEPQIVAPIQHPLPYV